MKKISILLSSVFLLSACLPVNTIGEALTSCSPTLDGLTTLTNGLELPAYFREENPVKRGGEFNVMEYFTVFDHLSMKPGYVLDYVYHFDGMGGFPVLYARPVGQVPHPTEADLNAAGEIPDYLQYIQVDDTPESYFQLVLLMISSRQFYLYWHANYNDRTIVCDQAAVRSIVSSLDGTFGYRLSLTGRVRAALLTDLEPSVLMNDETAEVQITTFTIWGGFFRETYTFDRQGSHALQNTLEENLVPYDCGVMF